MQAVERAPAYALPPGSRWPGMRERLGDRDWRDRGFRTGARRRPRGLSWRRACISRVSARRPAAAMPEGYVRALFDQYAAGFDQALTEGLDYRAPELLFRAVETAQAGDA